MSNESKPMSKRQRLTQLRRLWSHAIRGAERPVIAAIRESLELQLSQRQWYRADPYGLCNRIAKSQGFVYYKGKEDELERSIMIHKVQGGNGQSRTATASSGLT